jgi:hypothetical protein
MNKKRKEISDQDTRYRGLKCILLDFGARWQIRSFLCVFYE